MDDQRSKEEKVSDLTDLFIGDYHIDTDIIHAVLEECDWNVESASEKLFEVFFSTKPVKNESTEPDDLATIAVSLLSNDKKSKQNPANSVQGGEKLMSNMATSFGNMFRSLDNQPPPTEDKPSHNLKPKIYNCDTVSQFNYSTQNFNEKPSIESKSVFESGSRHTDFCNKNSFGDMALNMDDYGTFIPKSSSQNILKGESPSDNSKNLNVCTPSQKIKPKYDSVNVPVLESSTLSQVDNSGVNARSNSALYSDKSIESLFNKDPSMSKEWNLFYKQLNLQPLQTNKKTYPDIDIQDLLKLPEDLDSSMTVAVKNSKTNNIIESKKSNENLQGKTSSNLDQALCSRQNSQSTFQIPKVFPSVNHEVTSPGEQNSTFETGTGLESSRTTVAQNLSTTNSVLSPVAPEFVPRVLEARHPMRRKSPVKQISSSGGSTYSHNHNKNSQSDKFSLKKKKGVNHNHSQTSPKPTISKNINFSQDGEGRQNPKLDPMDPAGWPGISKMALLKNATPPLQMRSKDFHFNLDNSGNNGVEKIQSQSAADKNLALENSVMVPPFSFNIIPPSNTNNRKTVGKKKGKVPKTLNTSTAESLMTHSITSTQSEGQTVKEAQNLSSSIFPLPEERPTFSLPPSLHRGSHPHRTPNSQQKAPPDHLVPKLDPAHTDNNNVIMANKVQFVGVKSPMGKLKHYIDKKQPVMFILRGLPGSGKSFLASQLVSECQRFNVQVTSQSTDAYFTDAGVYNFKWQKLDEAHLWNQQKARQWLREKYPVVIIDNTNTTMQEMMPYAEMAILNAYDIQVCEPDTQWKNKLPELARRNQHMVHRDQIKRMKDRYEMLSTDDVIRAASISLKAKNKLPLASSSFQKNIPAPQGKGHILVPQIKSNLGGLLTSSSILKSKPSTSEGRNEGVDIAPPQPLPPPPPTLSAPLLVHPESEGMTHWMPAMEQRVASSRKPKKSSSHAQAKVSRPATEITLDFLNNSIKKALVGIERQQQEEGQEENERAPVQEFQYEWKKELGDVKVTADEAMETENVDDVVTKTSVDSQSASCDGYKHSKEQLCVSPEEDLLMDEGQKVLPAVYPGSPVPVSSPLVIPTCSGLDNSASTSDSFHSCDDREKIEEANDEEVLPDVSDGKFEEASEIVSERLEAVDLKDGMGVSQSQAVVGNAMESACYGKNVNSSDAEVLVVTGSLSPSCGSRDLSFTEIETSSGLIERDALWKHKEEEVSEREEMVGENTAKFDDQLDASHASGPSLVMYSDSEDEEEVVENCGNRSESLVMESEFVTNVEAESIQVGKTASERPDVVALGHSQGQVETNNEATEERDSLNTSRSSQPVSLGNSFPNASDLTAEVVKVKEGQGKATDVSVQEQTSEKDSSAREESPDLRDSVENSPGRKKKKKKVKPIISQGPFLEESLKEKSKTENWSSFFFNNSTPERSLSPVKVVPKVTTSDAWGQCESYYFSMVYRLNSKAFCNQQPIDVSNCDVTVLTASDGDCWQDKMKDFASVVVERKSETTDRSTITDETLVSEQLDLDTLQNCFPEYSRKQLEEVMAVCQNDLEWVSNHLLDCPPLVDVLEEDREEENREFLAEVEEEDNIQEKTTSAVKSLAQLCRHVVQTNQVIDSDDFEQQVIQAGQTRLERIETFKWTRLLSQSSDHSQRASVPDFDIMPDDIGFEEPPFTWALQGPQRQDVSSAAPFHVPGEVEDGVFAVNGDDQHPSRATGEGGEAQLPHFPHAKSASKPAVTIQYGTPPLPALPVDFVRNLERCFGPLNAELEESDAGLVLSEATARKIHQCLKLQLSKKHVGSHHLRQMKEDEAMARALQEKEDAAEYNVSSSQNLAVPGWTNQTPSWMAVPKTVQQPTTNSCMPRNQQHQSSTSFARMNSVSEKLHEIRGAWPKRLKPQKFRTRMPRQQQDFSVWARSSQSHKRQRADDMHSIMREEQAREARVKQMVVLNQATGDTDALATKLKRSKLGLMFPFIPPDVLEEIFMNNGYCLEDTVKVLEAQYERKPAPVSMEIQEQEIDSILRNSDQNGGYDYIPEEADESMSYEDLRKEAYFYSGLANECRQKAQRHHGEGMHHAAFFYRQEVKKYLAQKDEANQRAARLLFEKGHERLLRENTLDLHSYHVKEAIEAVNLALEMKKEEYTKFSERKRGYLTIVTGRGWNSRGGTPKLKPSVISHLSNRGLRFEEVSPGMLKVNIFQD